jgi:NitT/TauT family transport system permease protein
MPHPAFGVNSATLACASLESEFLPRGGYGVCRQLTAGWQSARRHPRCAVVLASAGAGGPSSSAESEHVSEDVDTSTAVADEESTFVLEQDEGPVAEDESTFVFEEESAGVALARGRPIRMKTLGVGDAFLVGVIMAIVYGLAATTRRLMFSSTPYTALVIDTSLRVLPSYAVQSLTRMVAGYVVSLLFSLSYAYIAFRVKFAAQALMLAIDVFQSIPLLSFLPGVVLGLISIFPAGARIGVELAAVLLLFTSMAWNMLLGFYQSLAGIPHDLQDVAQSFRLTPWKRFWVLELPAGAIGLVWNSIISVAGGWFFLISIESFELGNRDFRLPGLGSFLAAAAEAGNYSAIAAALGVIICIIIAVDFCVWRPILAWSSKFKYGGGSSSSDAPKSFVFNFISRSPLMRSFARNVFMPAWESFVSLDFSRRPGSLPSNAAAPNVSTSLLFEQQQCTESFVSVTLRRAVHVLSTISPWLVRLLFFGAVAAGSWRAGSVMRIIATKQWILLMTGAACTFGRVCAALALSLVWTVPVGIAIGRNPKLAERVQPVVQIAASVPATAVFPVFLAFLAQLGGGLEIGSIALMTLGTMWYVLVNVIAGTQAIPAELFDVDAIYGSGWVKRWRTLILPGIFPYLITGVVTAVGGAWNASIVSEYVVFRGGVMQTHGLGALISQAAATGNYALLLAGTVVMSVLVLLTNRFVWGPLQRLSETKYRM